MGGAGCSTLLHPGHHLSVAVLMRLIIGPSNDGWGWIRLLPPGYTCSYPIG